MVLHLSPIWWLLPIWTVIMVPCYDYNPHPNYELLHRTNTSLQTHCVWSIATADTALTATLTHISGRKHLYTQSNIKMLPWTCWLWILCPRWPYQWHPSSTTSCGSKWRIKGGSTSLCVKWASTAGSHIDHRPTVTCYSSSDSSSVFIFYIVSVEVLLYLHVQHHMLLLCSSCCLWLSLLYPLHFCYYELSE